MIEAPLPANEAQRLAALHAYRVLDTAAEQGYDDLTELAAHVFDTPIALVSLVDAERQWFKSRFGLDAPETPRSVAFCSHAILQPDEVLVVPDSFADARFADNPLATGAPHVRFYAGAPLVSPDGMPLGTLCVIDNEPRQATDRQIATLRALARQVVNQLELRRTCTDLGRITEALRRSNGELEQFSYVAAHDLQEPLRKLNSFSELLRQDLGPALPEAAAQDLGFIEDAAGRMRSLITDLLQLSRTSTAQLSRVTLPLADCVQRALEAVSNRTAETGATITCDQLPTVTGDATLLTQLFQNLVGNALKFVRGRKPAIRITCEQTAEGPVFGVRDNGIGIAPEFTEQVFAPFKRLNGRSEFEGTGIGLSICRKAVERHNGRIWVESTPGEGSHFRFTLAPAPAVDPVPV